MANKPLKSIKYPGLSDTYTFVQIGTEAGQAADAKVVGDEISDLKEDLSDLLTDKVVEHFDASFVQNRALVINNVLTESTSNAFVHSAFLDLGKDAIITIAMGYKIFAWDGEYDEFGHAVTNVYNAWQEGTANYTYRSSYPYLMICVMKDGTQTITPSEAAGAVTITHTEETIFAKKADLSDTDSTLAGVKLSADSLLLTDEIAYSVTVTADAIIASSNGRPTTGVSGYSYTSLISVKAGTIVYIPYMYISDGVAILSKNIPNATPLYNPLVVASNLKSNGLYYFIGEDCKIAFSGLSASISQFKLYYPSIASISSANKEKIDSLVVSEKIETSYSVTANTFIYATTGEKTTTTSDISCTSDIDVDAGTIVYIPKVTASDAVCLLGKVSTATKYTVLVVPSKVTESGLYYLIDEDCKIAFSAPTSSLSGFKLFESPMSGMISKAMTDADNKVNALGQYVSNTEDISTIPTGGQIVYNGDTKSESGYIVNAIAYDDGVIIGARSNGKIVRIGFDAEETLLTLTGTNMDWRCLYKDSHENVFASPHASLSGSLQASDRGLYKLEKGNESLTKVISLSNSDTIWTMCEDSAGNLYAGVYAHDATYPNPSVYKSTDGGDTWTNIFNFKTEGLTPDGVHIHSIIYSKWQKALYCIVGEVNTIFKSTDGGDTWTDLHVTLTVKGSAMLATEYGIFIGSDGAHNCDIDLLYNDDVTHEKVFRGWANTVFAIRRSDVTGFIYAFTKVDSSVNTKDNGYYMYFPPNSVFDAPDIWDAIDEWKSHISTNLYNYWYSYYQSVADKYPDDAIRPRHSAILVSRDGGKKWEVLKAFDLGVNPNTGDTYIDGFWTTGYFKDSECLTGRVKNGIVTNPVIISEGKHKYVSGGCDLSGEIFVRTNTNSTVTPIKSD